MAHQLLHFVMLSAGLQVPSRRCGTAADRAAKALCAFWAVLSA